MQTEIDNWAVCEKCRKIVPSDFVIRDGKVFITKQCKECGTTEAMVSTDAENWKRKREIWHYHPDMSGECKLNCAACGHKHHPAMVFLNVTNRCNMNCPICIANIPGMGFEFTPPLDYFERVLDGLAQMTPRPIVNLFGGEPTVRKDLFEIIKMAQARKLKVGIVTNGLRLADEEFCKKVCETGSRVLLAFDGRHPDIYTRLRKNTEAYDKKLKALENLKKFTDAGKRRHTLMCCVARGINDQHMRDLIDFCHENRDFIQFLHLIPLTETWDEGEFESNVTTTSADVEEIIDEALADEKVEFLPAGLGARFQRVLSFFGSPKLRFGGVHPNCESATFFFSDGERYRPVSQFLKRPVGEIAEEAIGIADAIEPRLRKLDPKKWFQRWRGRLFLLRKYWSLIRHSISLKALARGNPFMAGLKVFFGTLVGKSFREQMAKHTKARDPLYMIVLPFEEYHSIDGKRLHHCASAFAFEDPETGKVDTIPVSAWPLHRDGIERGIVAKYATERDGAPAQTTS